MPMSETPADAAGVSLCFYRAALPCGKALRPADAGEPVLFLVPVLREKSAPAGWQGRFLSHGVHAESGIAVFVQFVFGSLAVLEELNGDLFKQRERQQVFLLLGIRCHTLPQGG